MPANNRSCNPGGPGHRARCTSRLERNVILDADETRGANRRASKRWQNQAQPGSRRSSRKRFCEPLHATWRSVGAPMASPQEPVRTKRRRCHLTSQLDIELERLGWQPFLEQCGPRSIYRQLGGPFPLLLFQKFDSVACGPFGCRTITVNDHTCIEMRAAASASM